MRRAEAGLGSAMFLIAAPGIVAGLVPWWLTEWQSGERPIASRAAGLLLIAAGASVLLAAFVGFATEGRGTPAPVAPTERLVIAGPYRYVRNPMYLAVIALIVGQGLLLGRPILYGYAAVIAAVSVAFVRWYEEPFLRRRYGAEYEEYAKTVRPWLPIRR
jgi:protein-S-isoprenylcysteine O-methyltransferase Ste14